MMIYSSGGKRKKFIQEAHLIIMSFIIQLTSNFRYGSSFNDAINGGMKKNRTDFFIGFKSSKYLSFLTGSNNQFRNCESEFFKPNSKLFRYLGAFLNYVDQKTRYLGTVLEMSTAYINFTIKNSKECSFAIDGYIV